MRNWEKIKLRELLTESRIIADNPDANKRLTVRLNTLGVEKRPFLKEKKGATKYFVRSKNQFIYGRQNLHKGAFGIIPEELDGYESSSDIPAFDVDKSCLPKWIYYFFKKGDFYLKLESLARGVGSKRINPNQIFDLDILLPSLDEQKVLLEKVSEFYKKYDAAKNEFENQIEYFSQLRQSILEDAVTGKLTENWRKINKDVEPVENLIEKINIKRNELIRDNKIKNETAFPEINKNEIIYSIPNNWAFIRMGNLATKIEAGKSPNCDPFPAQEDEWGVIKISAISWGRFQENENKRLPNNIEPFIDKEIKPGDFLLSRSNTAELVGRSVIVGDTVRKKLLLSDKTLRIYLLDCLIPEYINLFNNSILARTHYLNVLTGTIDSMKNISRENIKSLIVNIPPLEEQKFILSKVNKLNSQFDNLEKEAKENIENAQKILDVSLVELLGENMNMMKTNNKVIVNKVSKRINKFESNTTLMDLVELLQKYGKLHAEDLWKMSKFPDNIDAFYAELKYQIENENSIKEVENEKGYLVLA